MHTQLKSRAFAIALALTPSFSIGAVAQTAELDPADPIAGKSHWAFQPLSVRDTPPIANLSDAIDTYIQRQRDAKGLTSTPPADAETWFRRVTHQLSGLPPSLKDLASFVQNDSETARERVVDRLLNDVSFGERWGRHWLDLARYADSNGLDENFLFREAWRYRNWVIDALNQDMPFDRFVLEQIAGDLLPYDSIAQRDAQRIASGFLVVGPKVLLGVNPSMQKMDIADEQLQTIGRTFLGLTIGCARCHDHKFDPIPTADYYALAGIMTSTQVVQQRYMLGQQRVMERLVGLGPKGATQNAAYEKYWRELPKTRQTLEQAKEAREVIEQDDSNRFQEILEANPKAVGAGVDSTRVKAERLKLQDIRVEELAQILANPPPIPSRAMIPTDVDTPADEAIRSRGAFDRPEDAIARGFLQVLSTSGAPTIDPDSSGRIELAQWLTDVERGAGILTARVLANRVWGHLMGRGLVRTMDNFGRTGEAPSHPRLLDRLARQLIEDEWSIKTLIRHIALSNTFALSAANLEDATETDPENKYYWRANRTRRDPESLRDAILSAADSLDLAGLHSSVWYLGDQATAVGANKNRRRTDFPNRSVYLPVIRNDLPEIFESFDFADPHVTTGARPQTTDPTQSLFMLNDTTVTTASDAIARMALRLPDSSTQARVSFIYQRILQTRPTPHEIDAMGAFIEQSIEDLATSQTENSELTAISLACQALFASSRFQFID